MVKVDSKSRSHLPPEPYALEARDVNISYGMSRAVLDVSLKYMVRKNQKISLDFQFDNVPSFA